MLLNILSVLFVYLIILVTSFAAGYLILSHEKSFIKILCIGFALNIAVLEVLTFICFNLKTDFCVLFASFIIYLAFIVVVIFGKLFITRKYKNACKELTNGVIGETAASGENVNSKEKTGSVIKSSISIWLVLFILVAAFQIFNATYLRHADADDGFYVVVSNIAVSEDRLELSNYMVYDGVDDSVNKPVVFCWEFYIAVISKLTGVSPAVLCHTVLVPLLIAFSYMALYLLARALFDCRKKQHAFMFFYSILLMFAGYSTYSKGCFLLLRIWQGKAVLACFVLPLLLASVINIYKKDYSWKCFLINLIIALSGMGFSVIGIYFMPIAYFAFGTPCLLYMIYKKEFKNLGIVIKRLMISVIPILFALALTLFKTGGGEGVVASKELDWKEIYKATFAKSYIPYLFIICVIINALHIFLEGRNNTDNNTDNYTDNYSDDNSADKTHVDFIVIIPVLIAILMGISFLNPFLCNLVANRVTGAPVYWRLYWIVPVFTVIASAFSLIVTGEKTKKPVISVSLTLILSVVTALSGTYIFTDEYFGEHTNFSKLPPTVIGAADKLLELDDNPVSVFPADMSFYVRQYNTCITVIGSRTLQGGTRPIGDTGLTFGWLYGELYGSCDIEAPAVKKALKILGIKYIFHPSILPDITSYKIHEVKSGGYIYELCV